MEGRRNVSAYSGRYNEMKIKFRDLGPIRCPGHRKKKKKMYFALFILCVFAHCAFGVEVMEERSPQATQGIPQPPQNAIMPFIIHHVVNPIRQHAAAIAILTVIILAILAGLTMLIIMWDEMKAFLEQDGQKNNPV